MMGVGKRSRSDNPKWRSVGPARQALVILGATLCCAACGEPVLVALSALRDDEGDRMLVDEAFAILGLDWERTTENFGSIHLTLLDGDLDNDIPGHEGTTVIKGPRCYRSAVSVRDARLIAHEVGHLLDLDHVCDAPCPEEHGDNLMRGDSELGLELTAAQ